jgi:hypothetical protein
MLNNAQHLGWLKAAGTPYEIGVALGRKGADSVRTHLLSSDIWQAVNDQAHKAQLALLTINTKLLFPSVWQELEGLAHGLELPVEQVMAWNCRGDLLASTPDGCTTVVQTDASENKMAHNEDGLPFFKGDCFIIEAQMQDAPNFQSFCYPGSLPGHTFAFTQIGLVQTVNNLRFVNAKASIPRMVLGRALLAAGSLDDALNILSDNSDSGGFHMSLTQMGEESVKSIEFGAGSASIQTITEPFAHANHALHDSMQGLTQQITASSRDRQRNADQLIKAQDADLLTILRDAQGPGLPIRRDCPDDPDCENTLATLVISVSNTALQWSIYDSVDGEPAYQGVQY